MPDAHPDAPNEAVEAAARAVHVLQHGSEEGECHSCTEEARAVIQALVDGGHYVPKADAERAWNAEFIAESTKRAEAERDSAVARAEAAEAHLERMAREMPRARLAEAVDLLRHSKREHYYCDDCWYSCPKAKDGTCNDGKGDECDCGADAFNATIDAFLAVFDNPVTPEARSCICFFPNDVSPGTRIADLACPLHGVNGPEPGDYIPPVTSETEEQ